MDSKKLIGLLLTIGGAIALAFGVIQLTGGEVANGGTWAAAILGTIFFISGVGLMKSVKSAPADNSTE